MENPLFYLLLGLMMAWVVSYFYSFQANRRKLTALARWLEESLQILGSQVNSRWRGNDTLTVTIEQGRGVIKEVALVLAAQPKELFAMLRSLVRGGQDSLTIVAAINPPTRNGAEFEIFAANAPVPRNIAATSESGWQIENYPRGKPFRVAFRNETARDSAFRLIALLNDEGYDIRRISVRLTTPHLMFVFNMKQLPQGRSADLLQLVRTLAEEVSYSPPSGTPKPEQRENRPPKNRKPSARPKSSFEAGLLPNGHRSSNGHRKHDED